MQMPSTSPPPTAPQLLTAHRSSLPTAPQLLTAHRSSAPHCPPLLTAHRSSAPTAHRSLLPPAPLCPALCMCGGDGIERRECVGVCVCVCLGMCEVFLTRLCAIYSVILFMCVCVCV